MRLRKLREILNDLMNARMFKERIEKKIFVLGSTD